MAAKGAASCKNRYRFTSEKAREAGRIGGKTMQARRRERAARAAEMAVTAGEE